MLFFSLLILFVCANQAADWRDKIDHVVVIMMENRAFDHMLGYLSQENSEIQGLTGKEYNQYDPFDPNSERVYVSHDAGYIDPNFGHSYENTREQIFGSDNSNGEPLMNGFVKNAEHLSKGWGKEVMKCYNSKSAPVINTLAQEFAVFDQWFASHPGPTEVNRFFVHSGTAHGLVNNDEVREIFGLPQKTIYNHLVENNVTYNIYMEEVSTTLFFSRMRYQPFRSHYRFIDSFYKDAKQGTLPQYSFIEPRYFELFGKEANDQHPSHDVAAGELLLRDIYKALRESPKWEKTLFLITYDEHGGFYDHFPAPQPVPNPDGINSEKPYFNFTRGGIRIPTIAISPWIPKNTVIHKAQGPTPTSQYEHTSILAFLKKLYNLPEFLTKRDAWAGTFEHIFSLDKPRTDCPKDLPIPPRLKSTNNIQRASQPPNDLQWYFINGIKYLVDGDLGDGSSLKDVLLTEEQAGIYVRKMTERFLSRRE